MSLENFVAKVLNKQEKINVAIDGPGWVGKDRNYNKAIIVELMKIYIQQPYKWWEDDTPNKFEVLKCFARIMGFVASQAIVWDLNPHDIIISFQRKMRGYLTRLKNDFNELLEESITHAMAIYFDGFEELFILLYFYDERNFEQNLKTVYRLYEEIHSVRLLDENETGDEIELINPDKS